MIDEIQAQAEDSGRNSVRFRIESDDIPSRDFTPPPSPKQLSRHGQSTSEMRDREPVSPRSRKNFHSPHLRSNLTREQRDRDPMFFYEIVQTLGVGSMGSVARVHKRGNALGGSAREGIQEAVRRQKRNRECLNIPIIGGIFRLCIDGDLSHSRSSGSFSSLFQSKEDLLLMSNRSEGPFHMSESESVISPGSTGASQHNCYAMKSIHLNRVTDDSFVTELRNEIAILKQLDHPHIVRPIETFEHRNQIFIVMELCDGGDLYSRDPYTEEEAARIVSSILSAVSYMHSKNILHRDLKYENILFVNDSPQAEIKLIDFGLSKVYGDNSELTEGVGTIYTMAPEVLKGNYTTKADIWSVGVITFMLLSSQMPFYGRKRRHIVEQILEGQFHFKGRRWRRISEQAKAFIEELLIVDADDRLDGPTALSSTWLNRRFAATARGPDADEENMARHAMLRYAGYTKLKKMALMVVAHKSSSEEIGILRKVFQKYDPKRDGVIDFDGFCSALSEFGHSDDDFQGMFEAVDLDGTGKIRYTEFLAATIEAQGAISEERLADAFDRLDSDDSGQISAENLVEILGREFPREEIDEIIADADLTKDNHISYAEFLALWEDKHEQTRLEQLRLLGTEVLAKVRSDAEMNSFRATSSSSSYSSVSLLNEPQSDLDMAEARVDFVLQKHESGKQGRRKSGIATVSDGLSVDRVIA